jgi:hypothetical protein
VLKRSAMAGLADASNAALSGRVFRVHNASPEAYSNSSFKEDTISSRQPDVVHCAP